MLSERPLETGSSRAAKDGRAGAWLRESLLTLSAGGIVAAFGLILLMQNRYWFWEDDYQTYHLAGFQEIYRSWRDGEFPLLSRYSWQGGALAGEYQYGVFSVATTGCVMLAFGSGLPLPFAAAFISIVHLSILSAGSFRLGRRRELSTDLCMLLAVSTALFGWNVIWGAKAWIPGLLSFAWFPWFWWGMERAGEPGGSKARFIPAGIFLYLIVTAGWPYSLLMAAALSVWLSIRVWLRERKLFAIWPLACAWIVGVGLSAPAWLMLSEYVGETVRGQKPMSLQWEMVVPFHALWGLVFPHYRADWTFFDRFRTHHCLEFTGALVPAIIVVTGLTNYGRRAFRNAGWEGCLCVAALVLSMLPGAGAFRWSFRWLPLFSLALSLTAVQVLADMRQLAESEGSGKRVPSLGARALYLLIPIGILGMLSDLAHWNQIAVLAMATIAVAALWLVVERVFPPRSWQDRWIPTGVVLATALLTCFASANSLIVPSWPMDQQAEQPPLRRGMRYLSAYADGDLFPPNAEMLDPLQDPGVDLALGNYGMYAEVETINGYSPIHPKGTTRVFGFRDQGYLRPELYDPEITDSEEYVRGFLGRETSADGLLASLGVDGLILANRYQAASALIEANGWLADAETPRGTIYHRIEPTRTAANAFSATQARVTGDFESGLSGLVHRERGPAAVLLTRDGSNDPIERQFSSAQIRVRDDRRNSVAFDVESERGEGESLIVLQRPWFPGYRARLNGTPLPVDRFNLMMPAVRIPGGTQGVVTFEYRPQSLVAGAWIAGATLLLTLAVPGFGSRFTQMKSQSRSGASSGSNADIRSSESLTIELGTLKDVLQ